MEPCGRYCNRQGRR